MCACIISIEILTPDVVVIKGEAFGRELGHEGTGLVNGLSDFMDGSHLLFSFHPRKGTLLKPDHVSTLTSHIQPVAL